MKSKFKNEILQYGEFTVNNCGNKVFTGAYYPSDVLNYPNKLNRYKVPHLYSNHIPTDEEIKSMEEYLKIVVKILDIKNAGCPPDRIPYAENFLKQYNMSNSLPKVFKAYWSVIGNLNRELLYFKEKGRTIRILDTYSLEFQYPIMFIMSSSKESYGISLQDNHAYLFNWDKMEIDFCEEFENPCNLIMERITKNATKLLKYNKYVRFKGDINGSINAKSIFISKIGNILTSYNGYFNTQHALLYDFKSKTLAFFRSNGMLADMYIGTNSMDIINQIGNRFDIYYR